MTRRDSFQSIVSRINTIWTPDDWDIFRQGKRFSNGLTFLHEACHWYIQTFLVSRAIRLTMVSAFCQPLKTLPDAAERSLSKAIALQKLLSPITEGLALYAQYDYFPANYFDDFHSRSPFDALVELVVGEQFSFQSEGDFDLYEISMKAAKFFSSLRLSDYCLRRKRELLRTPFLIGEDHITGYLLIKAIVSRIRKYSPHYIADGLILPHLALSIYSSSKLLEYLEDPDLNSRAFVEMAATHISERLSFLLNHGAANFHAIAANHYSELLGKARTPVDWGIDWESYSAARKAYYDALFSDDAGLTLYKLDAAQDTIKFFVSDVQIAPTADGNAAITFTDGRRVHIGEIEKSSPRLRDEWYSMPIHPVRGRLIEAVISLGFDQADEFFHVTFVDHAAGLLTLSYRTIGYNLGYPSVWSYLQNAFHIDHQLCAIDERIRLFEKSDYRLANDVSRFKRTIYSPLFTGENAPALPIGIWNGKPDKFCNIENIFKSKANLKAEVDSCVDSYIALSLFLHMYDFARDGELESVLADIEGIARLFGNSAVDVDLMKAFVLGGEPHCYTYQLDGEPCWSTVGCYL